MKKQYLTIIIIILVLIAGAIFFTKFFNKSVVSSESGAEEKIVDISVLESIVNNDNTEITLLTAVDESISVGRAFRLIKDGKLDHTVIATMPDPVEGNVYEGWLVQTDPLDFFSTGILEKSEDGQWVLIYGGDDEMANHSRVIVTEETVVDDQPERHVIQGDF